MRCIALVVACATLAAPCRGQDTLTIRAGSDVVDGRFLTPHVAVHTTTVTRNDSVIRTATYTLRKRRVVRDGIDVFQLEATAAADVPGPTIVSATWLNHRTLQAVHYEERRGADWSFTADIDAARVQGALVTTAGAPAVDSRFELAEPSFITNFADAVLNAIPLRPDLVVRVATFSFAARRTEWRTFRVVGRDTITVGATTDSAWVVDEGATAQQERRRFWLVRSPPFFPRDVTWLRDGTMRRIEQVLRPGPH